MFCTICILRREASLRVRFGFLRNIRSAVFCCKFLIVIQYPQLFKSEDRTDNVVDETDLYSAIALSFTKQNPMNSFFISTADYFRPKYA